MPELDAKLTEVYRKLTRLHSALDEVNKGDHYYHQFFYLRKINGDTCKMLPLITPNLPIEFIEKELNELVAAFREYKQPTSTNFGPTTDSSKGI